MKGLASILGRYIGAAVGVGLILVVLNFGVVVGFVLNSAHAEPIRYVPVEKIAAGIERQENGQITVAEAVWPVLQEHYAWAMQLNDSGEVIWSDRMPPELPQVYTASDIAGFSRWYLNDYPVTVWSDEDGLLVLAGEPGSQWKYMMESSMTMLQYAEVWIPAALLLNLCAALLLALLLGWRMYCAALPLAQGISDLAQGKMTRLSERGVFRALSADLNRASDQLLNQRTLLQKRDRTRTEWIAGVSHDIRTPLALVQGNAAQMEADAALPHETREKARIVREQSQRIGRLVSDLNLASKLEYELQPLHVTAFHPATLLRAAAAELLNGLADERIRIAVDIPPALNHLTVCADETLLLRAVENLLRNSALHNTGEVQIQVRLEADEQTWRIITADDGSGLSESTLRLLYAPAGESLPQHGLGLVLVRQIVDAHGGAVRFINRNPGLLAELSFPVYRETERG